MTSTPKTNKLSTVGLVTLALLAVALSAAAILQHRNSPTGIPATPQQQTNTPKTTTPTTSTVQTPTNTTQSPTSTTPTQDPPVVVVIGDSHTVGDLNNTWVGPVAKELGWEKVTNLSSPGRGFVTKPRSCDFTPCTTFTGTIPMIAKSKPNIVITFGGTADGNIELKPHATTYFKTLRKTLPHAKLVAITPVTTKSQASDWLTKHARDITTAVEAVDGTAINVGQPGLGNGTRLSPNARETIAKEVVKELSNPQPAG